MGRGPHAAPRDVRRAVKLTFESRLERIVAELADALE